MNRTKKRHSRYKPYAASISIPPPSPTFDFKDTSCTNEDENSAHELTSTVSISVYCTEGHSNAGGESGDRRSIIATCSTGKFDVIFIYLTSFWRKFTNVINIDKKNQQRMKILTHQVRMKEMPIYSQNLRWTLQKDSRCWGMKCTPLRRTIQNTSRCPEWTKDIPVICMIT